MELEKMMIELWENTLSWTIWLSLMHKEVLHFIKSFHNETSAYVGVQYEVVWVNEMVSIKWERNLHYEQLTAIFLCIKLVYNRYHFGSHNCLRVLPFLIHGLENSRNPKGKKKQFLYGLNDAGKSMNTFTLLCENLITLLLNLLPMLTFSLTVKSRPPALVVGGQVTQFGHKAVWQLSWRMTAATPKVLTLLHTHS